MKRQKVNDHPARRKGKRAISTWAEPSLLTHKYFKTKGTMYEYACICMYQILTYIKYIVILYYYIKN